MPRMCEAAITSTQKYKVTDDLNQYLFNGFYYEISENNGCNN